MNEEIKPKLAARTALLQRSAVREFLKLTDRPDMISFAGGLPAPELFPLDQIRDATARVLSRIGPRALQYGESEGVAELRDWVVHRFSTSSFQVRREHVLITSGAQQALQLLGQILIDDGDLILVENPTYLALLSAWWPLGARFAGVPCDAEGLQVDQLDRLTAQLPKQPTLLYIQPNYQNPQGTVLSQPRREALLTWAGARQMFVIEDNAYGDLRYEGEPLSHLLHLASPQPHLDLSRPRVVHVGTFSKILAPGLRVGWVIASAHLIDKLTQAKQADDLHTSTLNQYLALELAGFLEQHLPVLRNAYRTRRDVMLASLTRHFPREIIWTNPRGGLFLMVTMPPPADARNLLTRALARHVAFVPGAEFHLDGAGQNTFRLNFSNATPEQIEEGVFRLGEVM